MTTHHVHPIKTLLFVQNGDARPKVIGRPQLHGRANEGLSAFSLTQRQQFRIAHAERWWLVECENAELGRHCISGGCEPYRCHRADGPMSCRILARGGKAVSATYQERT